MTQTPRVSDGACEPLGVSLTGDGINVAVHAPDAGAILFCLYDGDGEVELARIPLPGRTGGVVHGLIRGVGLGARYGLRADGPFRPEHGLRFNPHKLLLDPYALEIDRPFTLHPSMFGYRLDDPQDGQSFSETDSGPFTPKAVVRPFSAATPGPAVDVPWEEMVIYELHVRGFTRLMDAVPEARRGTFAGLAHPAAIGHLKALGITTVELLPAMAWIDERHLSPLGLVNYWGYNPVGWMVPDPRLAPGGWAEVRHAVDALADAGIEVVLDVVLNHSGEGDALGPTLSLRGLDNRGYYRLRDEDASRYVDDAGTGNALSLDRPAALRLAMDALRLWRRLGGVSGFRFDLAPVLGRRRSGFDPEAPLIQAISQDPELRSLKLIAEPWDCGDGGYQLGRFPSTWGEWNDQFRNATRSFWRGDPTSLGELARRFSGSGDLFPARPPSRSVNFVVAHDGFTLSDLVSYQFKRNGANGEDNRDGSDDNRSWNNGVEGPCDDAAVLNRRLRDQRALLATTILARGSPMLAMGAELGHSQGGNNNVYAQDNSTSWIDWTKADRSLIEFTARLIKARRDHPALRLDRRLTGQPLGHGLYPDVVWRRADGQDMGAEDWDDPQGPTLVIVLCEDRASDPDRVIVVFHRGGDDAEIRLPRADDNRVWSVLIDTAEPDRRGPVEGETTRAAPRSVLLLEETRGGPRARGTDPEVLGRLAAAAGISPNWRAVDGQTHKVGPPTQSALLAAMGLHASSTREALSSLRFLAETLDRPLLPALTVAQEGEKARIKLGFSGDEPTPNAWLSLEAEDGTARRIRVAGERGAAWTAEGRDGRLGYFFTVEAEGLSPGRYVVRREDRPEASGRLTISPRGCYAPTAIRTSRRLFGLGAQLYTVRRDGDQGIGDFTTLQGLMEAASAEGAGFVAINPLHALFPDRRDRASPYYPSDRRFLDPMYLDLTKLQDFSEFERPEVSALSHLPAVDYDRVWALKSKALEAAFAAGQDNPALDAFIDAGGASLETFAVFMALSEAFSGADWSAWPPAFRDPQSMEVKAFAQDRRRRIRFHQYLQWLCDGQLAEAARRVAGMDLGLCRDLAIGAAPQGAEAWAQSPLEAPGVSIGAPPDPFSPKGQVWGLPPLNPHRLWADGLGTLAELFAANMRHAGALRLDHIMGLKRQFWVPDGAEGAEGAYVEFPFEASIGELALESDRAKCLIIGEDLGSVPDGFREAMEQSTILSYRVLPFERDGATQRPPEAYPRLSFACVATHDLPTLYGWWSGTDIAERRALGLIGAEEERSLSLERRSEKAALLQALSLAGLVAPDADLEGAMTADLAARIHGFTAKSKSLLMMIQVDDLAGERVAVNLPGTDTERPNWRRRLAPSLSELFSGEPARAILGAVRQERPVSR